MTARISGTCLFNPSLVEMNGGVLFASIAFHHLFSNALEDPMEKFKNPQYIPDAPAYLSREVFLQILNIPRTTFYRQLRKQRIQVPSGLLSPKTQNFLCEQLGFPKIWPDF